MPVPGLLTVKLSQEYSSPFLIDFFATMDLRTIEIFLISLGLGFFTPFPKALSIFRIALPLLSTHLAPGWHDDQGLPSYVIV